MSRGWSPRVHLEDCSCGTPFGSLDGKCVYAAAELADSEAFALAMLARESLRLLATSAGGIDPEFEAFVVYVKRRNKEAYENVRPGYGVNAYLW